MNSNDPVPLERCFSLVRRSEYDSDEQHFLEYIGYRNTKSWSEIDSRYRTVIVAEAGAGKTHEMSTRAAVIENEGHPAFFIRIEDVVGDFKQAFEVGNYEGFQQWLSSQTEAWFFLDSVDEARLSNPRDFKKAICQFATAIKPADQRAHICISSRPYAWRPKSDRELIESYLPYIKPREECLYQDSNPYELFRPSESELEIFQLNPLNEDDIRLFAEHRSIPEIDHLIEELERSNLMTLAERPFDLEGILHKWKTDKELGGRSELLEHNIKLRLNEFEPNNKLRRPLESDKAREGARLLAAAVILCDKPGIQVPDKTHERTGIQADSILSNWKPRDIQTLLERAIFNDVIYGTVRFRHREVREFLAAEWFTELLQNGAARYEIEALNFRECYGEKIVSPRLRPILPWLILKDDNIRSRSLAIHPEIALEGGDPACLPLFQREKLLDELLYAIVQVGKRSTTWDNSTIAGIAQPDLTHKILSLIERHYAHDGAISFLGKLVWQGNMQKCVPPLFAIAIDPGRKLYPRKVATRAVTSCGTDEQKYSLWNTLLNTQAEISRELLVELLHRAATDVDTVALLLKSIIKLPPYNRFKVTGLRRGLHGYIDRLPISNSDAIQPMINLIDGLAEFLSRPPHIERFPCRVSREFRWLLDPATHAVERLVSTVADAAMQDSALAILLHSPAIRESFGEHYDDYKDKLCELVPAWPELNDVLFWQSVNAIRVQCETDGLRLNHYFQVIWPKHYWSFGSDSFQRVLDWVKTCKLEDDRLIALSLACHIFFENECPADWLEELRVAVKDDVSLEAQLDDWLKTMSKQEREFQQQEQQNKEKNKLKRQKQLQSRSNWIERLKADPDLIRYPSVPNKGSISYDQYWLLAEIVESSPRINGASGADWELLIDEFGDGVAHAYRDSAMNFWRVYDPGLPSEGANKSSNTNPLLFAMSGLEIESRECSAFPTHLDASEIIHALRYITWGKSGFPKWFETMYRAKPQVTMEAIQTELNWELDNIEPDQKSYGILHDLTHYAPWLHQELIEPFQTWLRENDPPNAKTLRFILHILKSGGMAPTELGALAKSKTTTAQCDELVSQWYAIWIDAQPDLGIPALSKWLSGLDANRSSRSAQLFVTALMDNRHHSATGSNIEKHCTAEHLKSLHVLMFTYIRVEDDIHSTGVHSPSLRDHAQDARNRIFNLLSEIPGRKTYVALMELTKEHPNPEHRSWMKKQAYKRAEVDGDLEPWTAEQISEFNSKFTITPTTQRQLFDLTVARITDMKIWLEKGDTSPYATWMNVEYEPEMRNLVADWLVRNAHGHFTIAQESEISNKQRIDILLQNPNTGHPIPIELKLLDKGWTGPKLCERLRNQLAGDYLRDGTERYGLMLLIRQGGKPAKRWQVDGQLVDVSKLQVALKKYWDTISDNYSNVAAIEVIVIDLKLRAIKSDQ